MSMDLQEGGESTQIQIIVARSCILFLFSFPRTFLSQFMLLKYATMAIQQTLLHSRNKKYLQAFPIASDVSDGSSKICMVRH